MEVLNRDRRSVAQEDRASAGFGMVRLQSATEARFPAPHQPKELGLVQRVVECIVIAVELGIDFFRDAA
ncbi:hypothetical protein [Sphingomonas albertensis]|uniref:Uncharacterized protein n=1 Tax=Sphingomonas albertensis TaxID=2762591 RepID=A0ABR7AN25_9SPHN|nr:hypothetical protein [Sphingomonas albertensis]MBC3941362.1 hypothetical protein [Sphingomonas albertensis]